MISWDPRPDKSPSAKSRSLSLGPLVEELIAAPRRAALSGPKFVVWLQAARPGDEARVGARTVKLGDMHETLAHRGFLIPHGFATSTDAFEIFLDSRVPTTAWKELRGSLSWCDPFVLQSGSLRAALRRLLRDPDSSPGLAARIELIRSLVCTTPVPPGVEDAIQAGYRRLKELYGHHLEVVVRSARADGDCTPPFFGDPREYVLGLQNLDDVLSAWRVCCAAMFDDPTVRTAIAEGTPIPGQGVGILVMSMVRSEGVVSGIVSTRDPLTPHDDNLHIFASRSMGTSVPSGPLAADALVVAKKAVRASSPLTGTDTSSTGRILAKDEVMRLAATALAVEEHYGCPVRVEWAQDSFTGEFMILQVNPLGTRPVGHPKALSVAPVLDRW